MLLETMFQSVSSSHTILWDFWAKMFCIFLVFSNLRAFFKLLATKIVICDQGSLRFLYGLWTSYSSSKSLSYSSLCPKYFTHSSIRTFQKVVHGYTWCIMSISNLAELLEMMLGLCRKTRKSFFDKKKFSTFEAFREM